MNKKHGYIVVTVLVFGSVFALLASVLVGYIFVQNKVSRAKSIDAEAFEIAEAGLNYYKWFLAHYPTDYEHGTGDPGPYVIPFEDPEGGVVGEFELEIDPNLKCNVPSTIDITSTGRSFRDDVVERTIHGRYARPSVAEYAYIINSSVWAGDDREISGRYHSNGGVRMDGTNDSLVTSAQEEWICTDNFGCSQVWVPGGGWWGGSWQYPTVDGVFGDGPNDELWEFPVPQVDFTGITTDLVQLKSLAQSSGRHFGPVGGQSGHHGYHIIFKANGTFDVYKVKKTTKVYGNETGDEDDWEYEEHIISQEQFQGNYSIPSSCSVIFVEDKLWLEGVVDGKVTIAAAKVNQANFQSDVILSNNLTYETQDGTDGLTVIAEGNVLIPLNSPTNLTLNGIFIAQTGRFGRNHYTTSGQKEVPPAYDSYVIQNALTVKGTIVSNGREGTQWVNGSGTTVSGYTDRTNVYDRKLATNPPPLTPYTSDEYRFVEWTDEN